MSNVTLGFSFALLSSIACASTPKATSCDKQTLDTPYDGMPVYHACAVDRRADPPRESYPIRFTPSGGKSCYRATVEFVIDTAGRPVLATARAVRSNDPSFYDAAVQSLAPMRYIPAMKDGKRVQQVAQRPFSMRQSTSPYRGAPAPCT